MLAAACFSVLAGCTSMITEEQLAEMRRLRAEDRTLNEQIRMRESEISQLKSEINSRQSELDRCNSTKQFIEGKMAQWPNVWPDWTEVPAQQPTESKPRR